MPEVKRLVAAGGVVMVLLVLFWRVAGSVSRPENPPSPGMSFAETPSAQLIAPSPLPSPIESATLAQRAVTTLGQGGVPTAATRVYAVSLPELAGLPADSKPGTMLELWVAWEPPITKHPRIQRLATGITLDRIVPPVTRDGSPAVLLRIPQKEIPSVLYGDRYGAMSAVLTGG